MNLLRHGDRNHAIQSLQRKLNVHGSHLVIDGAFGDATEAAVRAYQRKVGLVADGIAGPKTLASLQGDDCRHLLRHVDLVNAAKRLTVPTAAVYALNEVESQGRGFLDNGKPVILYERHIMYRQLQHLGDLDLDALVREFPALVNPNPGGYVGNSAEHQRLTNARRIDDSAALESASWGAFQIMGFHWARLGYSSVQDFTAAMARSEAEHLAAFIRFIETDPPLHKALKALKWATVARLYNGADYKRNLYDVKLQRAFERHKEHHEQAR